MEAADWLASEDETVQEPLRAVVAQRLVEPLQDPNYSVEPAYFSWIEGLASHWPDDAPSVLLNRLEHGVDRSDALLALVEVFLYMPRNQDLDTGAIVAVLKERCDAVEAELEPYLSEACDGAISRFEDPADGGFLRGFGTTSLCGGARSQPSSCEPLEDEWQRLVESSPSPQWIDLGSTYEVLPREDDGIRFALMIL
jgi:hypothetical protein